MTPEFWFQLATLLLAGAGALGTVYGVINKRVSEGLKTLHGRVDEVQKDISKVKDEYVRNDHLTQHLGYLKEDVSRIERGQEALGAKMDGVKDDINKVLVPALVKVAEAAFAAGANRE